MKRIDSTTRRVWLFLLGLVHLYVASRGFLALAFDFWRYLSSGAARPSTPHLVYAALFVGHFLAFYGLARLAWQGQGFTAACCGSLACLTTYLAVAGVFILDTPDGFGGLIVYYALFAAALPIVTLLSVWGIRKHILDNPSLHQ